MLMRTLVRRMSSLAEPLPKASHGQYPIPNDPKYKKLMQKQTLFSTDDGRLVWQKTSNDVTVYRFALVMVGAATLITGWGLLKLVSPPKN